MNQIHSASLAQDELLIEVDVTEARAPQLRPDDTWQALGRAIGDARADELVRASERRVLVAPYIAAPPARHVVKTATPPSLRVPESLYPVELPPREPHAVLSAQHPAFQWRESAEASLSLSLPVRHPRALRTARMVVAGVTAVGGLVCVLALVLSRTSADDAGARPRDVIASQPPPESQTLPPEKPLSDRAAVDAQATSWKSNVVGAAAPGVTGADRPGVSVDSLPRVNAKPQRRATKKR